MLNIIIYQCILFQLTIFFFLLMCVCVFFLQIAGELICPAYHELCSVDPILKSGQCPKSCNSNGDCVDGKCHCFIGFDGRDCSKSKYLFVYLFTCEIIYVGMLII